MTTERPIFTLRLRSPPGGDPINDLRWALKRLKDAGLTCTELTEDTTMSDQRMVKICEMWQRKAEKTGKTYFSGFAGPVQYLMFDGGRQPHPTRPDEEIHVWRLLVQERDAERRPQRQEQPAREPAEADEIVF